MFYQLLFLIVSQKKVNRASKVSITCFVKQKFLRYKTYFSGKMKIYLLFFQIRAKWAELVWFGRFISAIDFSTEHTLTFFFGFSCLDLLFSVIIVVGKKEVIRVRFEPPNDALSYAYWLLSSFA